MYFKLLVVFSVSALLTTQAEVCKTPNDESAECVSLYSCPALLSAIGSKQSRAVEFVRQSNCGGTATEPKVCCGTSANFVEKTKTNSGPVPGNLIPDRRYCGYQHSDDYFHEANETAITESPWLAWVIKKVRDNENLSAHCSGSLITVRFVLSAASCIADPTLIPVSVRLGEYHIHNSTDCTVDGQFFECSTRPEDFGIEKLIPHPKYNGKNRMQHYNIGLIKLDRNAEYSDYIRPVCLPLPGTEFANVGDILSAVSWVPYTSGPEIKVKTEIQLITNEECATHSASYGQLTENQFCTRNTTDTRFLCEFDNFGTPVTFVRRAQWHIEGLISHGLFCWSEPKKHVQILILTKVVNYLDWIIEQLES